MLSKSIVMINQRLKIKKQVKKAIENPLEVSL